jgi:uncharacterized protein (TIGR00730 family)
MTVSSSDKKYGSKLDSAKLRGEVIDPKEFQSSTATWRIFRIMSEFVEGYDFLSKIKADITVFGSARLTPDTKAYQDAEALGKLLAEKGFSVVTGGGPGIMEAANKGAFEAGGESVGLNIQLPFEQRINPYVRHGIAFHFFFTRKVMLTSPSQAFVAFPGGFGTIDEVMEVLTLLQTGKMQRVPVILFDSNFWGGLVDFIHEKLLAEYKTVSEKDLELFHVVDTPEEALKIIMDFGMPDGDHELATDNETYLPNLEEAHQE